MAIPNLTDYAEKKPKGLVTIQRINDNDFAIGTKNFDPSDGTELPQEVAGVTLSEVDDRIAELQAQIDELEVFKVDLAATK